MNSNDKEKVTEDLTDLLENICANFGHKTMRNIIAEFEKGTIYSGRAAFIQTLLKSLQESFESDPRIESLPN